MRILDGKGEYTTKEVDHIIKKYLTKMGITWNKFWKILNIANVRTLLVFAENDYKKRNITLDDLSTIANDIYWRSQWNEKIDLNAGDKLGSILLMAAELSYYNWRKQKRFVDRTLRETEEYCDKYKYVLKQFSN